LGGLISPPKYHAVPPERININIFRHDSSKRCLHVAILYFFFTGLKIGIEVSISILVVEGELHSSYRHVSSLIHRIFFSFSELARSRESQNIPGGASIRKPGVGSITKPGKTRQGVI